MGIRYKAEGKKLDPGRLIWVIGGRGSGEKVNLINKYRYFTRSLKNSCNFKQNSRYLMTHHTPEEETQLQIKKNIPVLFVLLSFFAVSEEVLTLVSFRAFLGLFFSSSSPLVWNKMTDGRRIKRSGYPKLRRTRPSPHF